MSYVIDRLGIDGKKEVVTKDDGLDFPGKGQRPERFRITVVPSKRLSLSRLFIRTAAIELYHYDMIELLPKTIVTDIHFIMDAD